MECKYGVKHLENMIFFNWFGIWNMEPYVQDIKLIENIISHSQII